MNHKILLVDDDLNILQGYKRQLRKLFQLEIAIGGKEGLKLVSKEDPFAVIVSDMQMPKINGIQFLNEVRTVAPNSVRMMLTGNADQKTAMDAVNDGQIFRFLTKPCSPEAFIKALEAGIEQYRLVTVEQELLSKTLTASVRVLTEVLSLVNPTAFGHTTKVRRLARQICQELKVDNAWEIELAAMLSQVGCVTIPETTLAKLSFGEKLTMEERRIYHGHPQVGHDLIAKIPRLENVAKIIARQNIHFDESGIFDDDLIEDPVVLGSYILNVAIDAAHHDSSNVSMEKSMDSIRNRLMARPN
ncbi:MAG: HD domain-containing phosphohydrolase [Pirellulales bacterium]